MGVQTCRMDGTYGVCICPDGSAPAPDAGDTLDVGTPSIDTPPAVDAPLSTDLPSKVDVPLPMDASVAADAPALVDALDDGAPGPDVDAPDAPPRDATCAASQVNCSGVCVSTQSDNANCGACGTACSAGRSCVAGVCVVECATDQALCAGRCVSTQSDNNNCGACGVACGAGTACSGGVCRVTCTAGQTACGARCVDTTTDGANCGACGNACATGLMCSAGRCGLTCGPGLTLCGASCAATDRDPANCGSCGNRCPAPDGGAPTCAGGRCGVSAACNVGFGDCDRVAGNGCEADLGASLAHCGACGNACAAGSVCARGVCRVPTTYAFTTGTSIFLDACNAPGHITVLMSVDDMIHVPTSIGFPFPFYGVEYTHVRASSNGYLLFGGAMASGSCDACYRPNMPLPTPTRPFPALFIYNTDLFTRATGVCLATMGTAPERRFVQETSNTAACCGSAMMGNFTFEAILNEADGSMDYVYQTIVRPPPTYESRTPIIVGLQGSGTAGVTYEFVTMPPLARVTSGTSLHITPVP